MEALGEQVILRGTDSPEGNEILSRSNPATFTRCEGVSKYSGHAEENTGYLEGWHVADGVSSKFTRFHQS